MKKNTAIHVALRMERATNRPYQGSLRPNLGRTLRRATWLEVATPATQARQGRMDEPPRLRRATLGKWRKGPRVHPHGLDRPTLRGRGGKHEKVTKLYVTSVGF